MHTCKTQNTRWILWLRVLLKSLDVKQEFKSILDPVPRTGRNLQKVLAFKEKDQKDCKVEKSETKFHFHFDRKRLACPLCQGCQSPRKAKFWKGGWSWSLYLLKWKLPAAHPVVCVGVLSPRVSSHSPVPACLESEMDVAPFGLPGLFQITTVCSQTIFAYLHSNNICTLPLIQSIMNTSLDASLLRAPLYGANNAHTAQGFWGT